MATVINSLDWIIQEANRLGLSPAEKDALIEGVKKANAKMDNVVHGAARHLMDRTRAINSGGSVPFFADLNSTLRRLGH